MPGVILRWGQSLAVPEAELREVPIGQDPKVVEVPLL